MMLVRDRSEMLQGWQTHLLRLCRFVASATFWNAALEVVTTLCVVGGVIAAPLLTILAWVGLMLPPRAFLHAAAPAIFGLAVLWLVAAILSAHAQTDRRAEG